MPKINKEYTSLFEYLATRDVPILSFISSKLDKAFWPEEHKRATESAATSATSAPYGRRLSFRKRNTPNFIKGAFQPFADIVKDFSDTYKPYKSTYHAMRDLIQPVRGVGNIASGCANIVLPPFLYVYNALFYAVGNAVNPGRDGFLKNYMRDMQLNTERTSSWITEGYARLFRGTTQIITTPLVLVVKLPLRALITLGFGRPKIEDSKRIAELVEKGRDIINSNDDSINAEKVKNFDAIRHELHRKYSKGIKRGQQTKINKNEEDQAFNKQSYKYNVGRQWGRGTNVHYYNAGFNAQQKNNAKEYLDLFTKNSNKSAFKP